MIEYQKLVRDRIPQMIRNSGYTPITRVLDDEEYLECLERLECRMDFVCCCLFLVPS